MEALRHIHLLAENLSVIDSATTGCMYSTGSFTNHTVLAPNEIVFNFIGGHEWKGSC
jgi:hypothetical protein